MSKPWLQIAVGVLRCENEICLSLRQKHQSHADCWEFPGGKIEANESVEEALKREFIEELGIETDEWQPLIEIPWSYEKINVRLHVYQTYEFTGTPSGQEGQEVKWFDCSELRTLTFPEANRGILTALELGDRYMITGSFQGEDDFKRRLQSGLDKGASLCQLRLKDADNAQRLEWAQLAMPILQAAGAKLLINGSAAMFALCPSVDGLHLSSRQLFEYSERPIAENKLLGVSVHNQVEVEQALTIGADFILLSPVQPTQTHPDMAALGWEAFAEMVSQIPVPVFALGGMTQADLAQAKACGAQGIAAISDFWGR